MRIFRNPEIRFIFLADLLIFAVVVYLFFNPFRDKPGMWYYVLVASAAFLLSFAVLFTAAHRHHKHIRQFNLKVEKNLHGTRDLQLDSFKEGDFAVLQDVVSDMVVAHFRQEEQLLEDKRLLAQAMADISHQIKTPLAAISLTAERLAKQDMEPLERKLLTHRMLDLINRINGFVTTLLKISRLDADVVKFRKDSFSAKDVIGLSIEPLEAAMELRDVRVVQNVPENIMLEGDKIWLSEAFTNVLKNCMEHTPAGGSIFVDVTANAVYTQFVIRDTGTGIDPEDLPHIFERYYKGKDSGSNSIGIGLAFTQMVVRGMGGTIKAENQPDSGAMFTIRMMKVNV